MKSFEFHAHKNRRNSLNRPRRPPFKPVPSRTYAVFFILGTGVGERFNIKSVNVWQRNACSNLKN